MSDLVGNPEDRFSHNEAHIVLTFSLFTETDKFVLSMDVTQDPEKIKQAYLDPTGRYNTSFFSKNDIHIYPS